jgi:PAS domain S-box-containing protein
VGLESRREEANRMKAAILDAAPDPVVAIDEHLRILQLNSAAERAFGYTASEAIGSELVGLIAPPELGERYRRQLRSRLAADPDDAPARPVELVAMRSDGSTFPVEVTVAPVPATDPGGFAGYIRDVTGQKRTEERALKQSRAIADLAQARGELVPQLMLAEERTRQRIAQVLHDDALQRLLAARQDLLEASGPGGLQRVQRALEGTIERIREAVAALHPVTHQQGDLQTALSAVARQHATGGGFRYTVRVEPEASGVEDELVLSAAQELLANVAKHAQASRCSVSVERRGDRIELEVADDGVGIPAGRQERALREGHIGLASTVQRMKAIGGDGEVSSEVGKGTVVRASIPIGQQAPTATRRRVGRSPDRL